MITCKIQKIKLKFSKINNIKLKEHLKQLEHKYCYETENKMRFRRD